MKKKYIYIYTEIIGYEDIFNVKLTFEMLIVCGHNSIHFRLTNGCACESVDVFKTENVST